ncbi:putative phage abortive infection protein [Pseudomonas sp. MWU13-2517]|uniref:putative phage abortive infection protein n=1 Tax=Pseudomonas sp. MWU13-2517 TaxID=2929055 RepID=UPI00200BE533|nr:putative phage abortive infection protein [Pseudomonas sp. MWU13-2517]
MDFFRRITFFYWLESMVKPGEKINIKPLHNLLVFAIFFVLTVLFIDVYLTFSVAGDKAGHGEFGDFFGGVVNPVLTFLTFMGLLMTIVIQRVELKETRDELQRSANALVSQVDSSRQKNFEDIFLRMLAQVSEIVSSFNLTSLQRQLHGQACFSKYLRLLLANFTGLDRADDELEQNQANITQGWSDFWDQNSQELSRYFSILFVLMKYVDDKGYLVDPYISLLKASISPDELVLIYYYCVSFKHTNEKLDLANRFGIFDDIDINRMYIPEHHILMSRQIS